MKLSIAQRKMVAELVIGLSICGGAYYFLVQPLKRELIAIRAQTSDALTKSPVTTPPDPAKIQALLRTVREKSERIVAGGDVARSEAEMFSRLGSLAGKFAVRIEELRSVSKSTFAQTPAPAPAPAPAPNTPPGQPGDPSAPPIAIAKDARVQYEFSARGTYANITAFLAAIDDELGYSIVRSVRMVPVGEGESDLISVSVRTEHFDFDTTALNAILNAPAVAAAPESAPPSPSGPGGTHR